MITICDTSFGISSVTNKRAKAKFGIHEEFRGHILILFSVCLFVCLFVCFECFKR